MPRRRGDGTYVDEYTTNLEGAAHFEHYWNCHPEEPDRLDLPDDEKPGKICPSCSEACLNYDSCEEWCDECGYVAVKEDEDCECSDPSCPCNGIKRGEP